MIKNIDDAGVPEKIETETSGNEAVRVILEFVKSASGEYGIDPSAGGLEFTSGTMVKGFPNRCRLKVWEPESNELMAWFYKTSSVPFSRDRYSYGGIVWDLDKVDLENVSGEIDEWLKWLDSGLDPETRPEKWESAFPFDIPK